jgi:hypothetical protein
MNRDPGGPKTCGSGGSGFGSGSKPLLENNNKPSSLVWIRYTVIIRVVVLLVNIRHIGKDYLDHSCKICRDNIIKKCSRLTSFKNTNKIAPILNHTKAYCYCTVLYWPLFRKLIIGITVT